MTNKMILRAKTVLRPLRGKKGQTLVEYALIIAFIALVAVAVLAVTGVQVQGIFGSVSSQLSAAQSSH